ncbi:MAG: nickel-dependent hydrogenase large subunit [Proteobacteria bacterium]|nr:nickel-dependent hydrogenase large subunit [Pseudomonadota bacterium]
MTPPPARTRLVVGPFNRVEGDLEVRLDVADGRVAEARVNAPMFRGFEAMLRGRDPLDALTIVPRICGICSVAQSLAAARALAAAWHVTPPPNGLLMQRLLAGCENLADHLTHFYLFFMPDFARPCYSGRPWHAEALRRFGALAGPAPGAHSRAAAAARARWLELMGTLGGKWPHTGSVTPGGSARALSGSERLRLLARLAEMQAFLETTTFGAPLAAAAALQPGPGSDMALWQEIAADLALHTLGPGADRAMAWAAPQQAFGGGLWDGQALGAPDLATLTEDTHHAWLDGDAPLHPLHGQTLPAPDKPGAYTWCKAPRLAGRTVEVGALARQLTDGHAPLRALAGAQPGGGVGSTVLTRVLGRLVEIARLLPLMQEWLRAIDPQAPFAVPATPRSEALGAGLTEAARGSLGHWVRIEGGRIANYQIIAPTSWNFSPRDAAGSPGPLEAALVGAPIGEGDAQHVAVQHIVRSFDPCMVCTVH